MSPQTHRLIFNQSWGPDGENKAIMHLTHKEELAWPAAT